MTTNYNSSFLSEAELKKLKFKSLGKNVMISKNCTMVGTHNMKIGNNVRIDPFCFLSSPFGYINIEKFVHIASHVIIGGHNGVTIKKFSGIGSGTKIYSASENYTGEGICNLNLSKKKLNLKKYTKYELGKVFIGYHNNIGANCVILPGTNLGNNVSIAASSVLKGKFKSGYIYFGNPLKPLIKKIKNNLIFEKKLKNKI